MPVSLDFVAAGIPVLVEKPIADRVEAARRLSETAEKAGVPVLVGHHRRHHPVMRRARQLVRDGALGCVVAASALALFLKPDACFDVAWRKSPGGGPVLINLIHEIDPAALRLRRTFEPPGGDLERGARLRGRGHGRGHPPLE